MEYEKNITDIDLIVWEDFKIYCDELKANKMIKLEINKMIKTFNTQTIEILSQNKKQKFLFSAKLNYLGGLVDYPQHRKKEIGRIIRILEE